jgi:cation diffusion facilitator CzcD-associated flavoprotein CzcO
MQQTVVIVGSGFSGIAMGVMLKRAGIESFVILEKADDVGGTWRENTYPGAACDVPSHLYSFSFEPRAEWTRAFSPQAEIEDYLRHCATKYGLLPHMRFGSTVTGAEFDEASATWTVRVAGAAPITAGSLVLGNGALHVPAMPEIPGLSDFEGACFHSAQWDHQFDLTGKRVAVIGTGASAIQFVPQIAPKVGALQLFQRTPPWIVPKPDFAFSARVKRLFGRVPLLRRLYRASIYWRLELMAIGFVVNPRLMRYAQKPARDHLRAQVPDRALRARLTPNYVMGCKRVLLSNDYYPALTRPNVQLVTDGIERVTARGVRTRDGVEHAVDAIICGTGFTVSDYLAKLDIVGRHGRTLNDAMADGAESYRGISVHGFPNLFLLMGPNTGLGHNSMIFMIEAQARYALRAIQAMRRKRLASIDVRATVQRAFSQRLQAKLRGTVWNTGCSSWYAKDGHNATVWPYFTFQYWWQTRRVALRDYHCVPEAVPVPELAPLPAAAR